MITEDVVNQEVSSLVLKAMKIMDMDDVPNLEESIHVQMDTKIMDMDDALNLDLHTIVLRILSRTSTEAVI